MGLIHDNMCSVFMCDDDNCDSTHSIYYGMDAVGVASAVAIVLREGWRRKLQGPDGCMEFWFCPKCARR